MPRLGIAEPLGPVNPFGVSPFGAAPFGQAKPFGQAELLNNNDKVKFELGSQIQTNSNLFMLPTSATLAPGSKRADNIFTSYVGFGVEKDYGMQHFNLDFSLVDDRYQNNTFMNNVAVNYGARWLATITPALKATVNAFQTETPRAPESYGSSAPTGKQITTSQSQGVVFDFSPYQVVHVYGGYTIASNTTSDPQATAQANPFTNSKSGQVNAGLGYEFSSGTLIKLMNKITNGTQSANTSLGIGPNFNEHETNLSINWPFTGSSNIMASYGFLSRNDETYSNRNYSGQIGGIEYEKKITEDTGLNLKYLRGLQSYQSQTNSYDIINALIFAGNWTLTPKFNIKAAVTADRRDYVNLPGVTTPTRLDQNFVYSLDTTWKATQKIYFRAMVSHVQRNSNNANYVSDINIANISVQLYF